MTSYRRESLSPIVVILIAGLIAGTLDITAACLSAWIQNGVPPMRIFRYIAMGVLGPPQPGLPFGTGAAVLGLFLHYVIATGWAVVFYVASRVIPALLRWPVPIGLGYGIFVYLMMNFIVVPLSKIPRPPKPPELSARALQCAILMFCIGLPIALVVRRFGRPA